MVRRTVVAGVVALLASTTTGAVAHHTPDYTPDLVTQRVYFHCAKSDKIDNLNVGAPWNTTPPAASYTTGAGCAQLDTGQNGSTDLASVHDAEFKGTFTGHLDSLTVHAWNIDYGTSRATGEFNIQVLLQVDGHPAVPIKTKVTTRAISSSTGIARLFEFSVTGINLVHQEDAGVHQVRLGLQSDFQANNSTWVYDATEIPSGITFNPATLAPAVVVAKPR